MIERKDSVWKIEEYVAKYYDGIRGGLPFAIEHIEVMDFLINNLEIPPKNFLDIGCGNGILSSVVFLKHPKIKGVLVDFYQPILEEAMFNLSKYEENSRYMNLDISNKKWMKGISRSAPFDLVVTGFTFHHQTDKRKKELYKEVFKLLSPGGLFVNIEQVALTSAWTKKVADRVLFKSIETFHSKHNLEISLKQFLKNSKDVAEKANLLATAGSQCGWMRDAGYIDVDCYFKALNGVVLGGRKPK